MNRHRILDKPVWQHFLHIEGLHAIPLLSLIAADQVWEQVAVSGTVQPAPSDYAMWAKMMADNDPAAWLEQLAKAFAVILPSETANVSRAICLLPAPSSAPAPAATAMKSTVVQRDPCEYRANARARYVSINPWELPDAWQEILRRASQGLPGHRAGVPSQGILQRMCQKLCQLAWSAQEAGLNPSLSSEVVNHYLAGLETRLRLRAHGIRWATMRATAEELHRFARYSGIVSEEDTTYLLKRLTRYSLYEKGQDALKFQALLDAGNTTLRVLDKADALLLRASLETRADRRHLLRNAGAILGIFSIVPLRNADAILTLNDTLVWESGTWVIDTGISKTQRRNTDRLVVALEPEFGRYIDVVVQGDHDARHLPELRNQAMKTGGPLFVRERGKCTSPTYIPRLFKTFAGTSLTTARTMLHTDQAISRGEVGTRDTMAMAHQTSPQTALKYQAKRVRQAAIQRVQYAAADRRSELLTDDLLEQIRSLETAQEVHK
ncbi:hypothetical protein [Leisingera sp. JC1]|uniref:hypothetical protein n=1 Tax=Leisingera sp. JC1 TaxID=1855282 RepID=UPI0008033C85|nr:hypothetical protein [Leisingera sp. JC1]OBY24572.1 hypothetical protein A9D60_24085 [Leisingera sp. JC1]